MGNKTRQLILVTTVLLAFVALGYTVYQQEKSISLLQRWSQIQNNGATSSLIQDNRASNESNIQSLINKRTNIVGTITAITGNIVSIDAWVDDVSSFSNVDTSKPFAVSLIRKAYQVKITPSTVFTDKNLSELKVTDMLSISASVPVLAIDGFDATKVTYLDPKKLDGVITK